MAKFMGVPAQPLDIMYPEKAKEMKRLVLDYIKVLRRSHFNNTQNASEDITNGFEKDVIVIDESGFPLAPRPDSWSGVTRGDLESIYRLYITRHYSKLDYILRPRQSDSLLISL